MAENISYITFNCLNPDCRKPIRIKVPEKSGIYSIGCPHCGIEKKVKLKGLDAVTPPSDAGETTAEDNHTATEDIGDDFYVNTSYTIVCPHCRSARLTLSQDKPGPASVTCPECKGKITYTVRKPTEVIVKSELIQCYRGRLTLLRKGWLNKKYPLVDGVNTVGRYDEAKNSDIAIKGDPSMSRQSVEIHVDHHDKGYSFRLLVLQSANPVLHNSRPLAVGDSISLNFGDIIILGKTKFRFDKDT